MKLLLKIGNNLIFKTQQRLFSSYCDISESKFNKLCHNLLKVKSEVDLKNDDHKWPKNLLQELGGNKHTALEKLSSVAESCNEYVQLSEELVELNKMSVDSSDSELLEMAQEDLKQTNLKMQVEKDSIVSQILDNSEVDDMDGLMLEIVPGVGGLEASIFANELYNMYSNFILSNGCEFEPVVTERNSHGYLLKASVVCKPGNLYHLLRHEAGTHRVQRVPETESRGRIQTSTAAVSVIPKHTKNFDSLKSKEVKKTFTCSGGPGGQHANTKETKVTLTHMPTGITVTNCDTKFQLDNLNRATEELTYKVNQIKIQADNKKINSARFQHLTQISRSDKVRTYNFPQNRITDHRFQLQTRQIDSYFNGGSNLYDFLEKVNEKWEESERKQVLLQLVDEVVSFH